MRQLLSPSLLLSSILCCLFLSCSISKFKHPTSFADVLITKETITPILKEKLATKYKASIDVLKNHLSGILIVKQADSTSTHLIFVTELGMKMFDFEWNNNSMKSIYVFEPLNKPSLINVLQENFKSIFLFDVYSSKGKICSNKKYPTYISASINQPRFLVLDSITKLKTQQIFNKNHKSCFINYTFDSQKNTYSKITCTQFGIVKIRTELEAIE